MSTTGSRWPESSGSPTSPSIRSRTGCSRASTVAAKPCPQARGWTSGTTTRSASKTLTDAAFDRIEALEAFAVDRDRSLLELAFAWLLAQAPVASVIAGATSPGQVRANAAAGGWLMTADDLAAVP